MVLADVLGVVWGQPELPFRTYVTHVEDVAMRTNLDLLKTFDATLAGDIVTDSDLVGYVRPFDIVEDPSISLERKREMLAHWASDMHAVAGAPALRALAGGLTVSIDAILEALQRLDELPPPPVARGNGNTSTHG